MTNTIATKSDTNNQQPTSVALDLQKVIEDLFLVLTEKERDVIVKRFSIYNEPRQTLERIGQQFSVTRERIRQIEKIALSKLRRTVKNTNLRFVNDLLKQILAKSGGVMVEESLASNALNMILSKNDVDSSIVKLALHIDSDLVKVKRTREFRPFWRIREIPLAQIKDIVKTGIEILKGEKDVVEGEKIAKQIIEKLEGKYDNITEELAVSCLQTDHRIKCVNGNEFGLMTWRHINPKSIRDKAYVVLKKNNKDSLHFIDIANKITEAGFDRKVVTTQAVHNELIRCDLFVLVGRGLYALKEWGYKPGTVAEIIVGLLKKKAPLTKKEIIQGVLKQRKVKKGTISLNLQKVPCFVRVGRAVYDIDDSLGMK
ncbi:hypothetical protein KKG71_00995 [Patescibacteria group bacterium]|nr:hypothetical protein [Patescibacteria group bacterium]